MSIRTKVTLWIIGVFFTCLILGNLLLHSLTLDSFIELEERAIGALNAHVDAVLKNEGALATLRAELWARRGDARRLLNEKGADDAPLSLDVAAEDLAESEADFVVFLNASGDVRYRTIDVANGALRDFNAEELGALRVLSRLFGGAFLRGERSGLYVLGATVYEVGVSRVLRDDVGRFGGVAPSELLGYCLVGSKIEPRLNVALEGYFIHPLKIYNTFSIQNYPLDVENEMMAVMNSNLPYVTDVGSNEKIARIWVPCSDVLGRRTIVMAFETTREIYGGWKNVMTKLNGLYFFLCVLLLVGIVYSVNKLLLSRVKRMHSILEASADKILSFRRLPAGEDELGSLAKSFNSLIFSVEHIFDSMPFVLLLAEMDGSVTAGNWQASALLGIPREELRGRRLRDLVDLPWGDGEVVPCADFFETTMRGSGGKTVVVEAKVEFCELSDRVLYFFVGQDVSSRRFLDRSPLDVTLLTSIGDDVVAHANAVASLSRLIPTDSERAFFADALRSSSLALCRLVRGVLALNKGETGEFFPVREAYDLPALVHDVAAIAHSRASAKDLFFSLEVSPELPVTLKGDGQRLRQILQGVMEYAIDSALEGEVRLAVRYEPVSPQAQEGRLFFLVCNAGSNLCACVPLLPFDALPGRPLDAQGGEADLALLFIHRLTLLLKGEIVLESGEGESRIALSFPQEGAGTRKALPARDRKGCRVLLYSPRGSERALLGRMLDALGVEHVGCERLIDFSRRYSQEGIEGFTHALFAADSPERVGSFLNLPDTRRPAALLTDVKFFNAEIPASGKDTLFYPLSLFALARFLDGPHEASPLPRLVRDKALPSFLDVRVLVVDDVQESLVLLTACLTALGIVADQALSGEETLLRAGSRGYDMIFVDTSLPDMSAPELVRTLRERRRGTLFVALSDDADDRTVEGLVEAGMNDVLFKPVDFGSLLRLLNTWVAPRKILRAEQAASDDVEGRLSSLEDVLDVASALAQAGGDRALYLKLVGSFVRVGEKSLREIEDAHEATAWEDYRVRVQALKDVLLQVGARERAAAAELLEAAAERRDGAELQASPDFVRDLRGLLERLARVLERWGTDAPVSKSE